MVALKARKVGNSLGLTLPKDVTRKLKLKEGDTLFLTETQDGFRLTPYDPAFEEEMAVAGDIMKKRRNALRELAK
ncbi:MAG: AbrB/MazE/SpoVT family DNA-binding domain-containing protein [Proteobacteria bacterium]|nr:AbrB/MazE/SpoVT family DNA-binding domain-containing protein [Pseudomonadota bacterium]